MYLFGYNSTKEASIIFTVNQSRSLRPCETSELKICLFVSASHLYYEIIKIIVTVLGGSL